MSTETPICDACGDEIAVGETISLGGDITVVAPVRLGAESDPLHLVLCSHCTCELVGDLGHGSEAEVEEVRFSE